MGITNPLVSTTVQRKTVWGTVFLHKAMRLVKIKDALPSDDLNLVGIEKDRHLAVFLYLINMGFKPPEKAGSTAEKRQTGVCGFV